VSPGLLAVLFLIGVVIIATVLAHTSRRGGPW